jgi:hypothetical protein
MGHQIIKQPNGKYCIYSSIVDDIITFNATVEDIINERIEEAKKDIEKEVKGIVEKLNKGEDPYYTFTISFEEAIKEIKFRHGEKAETLLILKKEGVI